MATVLSVRDLTKQYGSLAAVRGVSFAIEAGTCFGLLGPNGAGKTTTIEMIEGILPPTSGTFQYNGAEHGHAYTEEVGIMFQHTSLLDFLTVRETLATFRSLYSTPLALADVMTLCSLDDIQKQYNHQISGGQRQRLLLALALVNNPNLVFLDEPSTGLDPQARRDMWRIVDRIKAEGRTVVLTTHYMEEAEHLCDIVAIMDHGRIIAQGTPVDLIREHCRGVAITLPRAVLGEKVNQLGFEVQVAGESLIIRTDQTNRCLDRLMALGIDLTDMVVRSGNLEDVFLQLTGRQLRE